MDSSFFNEKIKVLIIEPIGMGGELLLNATCALGYHSIVVTTENVYKSTLIKNTHLIDEVIFADFSDTKKAIDFLVKEVADLGISGVVVAWEFLTDVAAEIAEKLNVCGPDASLSKARRNKHTMYRVLAKETCPLPELQAVLTTDSNFTHIPYEELDYPLVVKPAENAASFGVSVVNSCEEFSQAFKDASQWTHEYPHGIPFSNEILVQEYIPGQEFSVEALSISGRYFPWGVTMKFTTSGKARAETGHIFPAPISDILRDKILGIAEKAALALGITNGISHTEIKLDKNGEPRVIESCSRPAGDYIPRLVKLSTGEDPLEIYVKQAVGELHTDFSPAKPYCFSAIQFIRPNIDGKFVSINIPSVLSSAKIVDSRITVVENSHVQPGTTNIERLGWTIISADTADAIVGAMEELENSTRIFIE